MNLLQFPSDTLVFPKFLSRHLCSKKSDLRQGFPSGSAVKNLPATQETLVWSLGQEDPLEEAWQPTPVFLPGESHGCRSLAGSSPWGHRKSDMTAHALTLASCFDQDSLQVVKPVLNLPLFPFQSYGRCHSKDCASGFSLGHRSQRRRGHWI